MARTLAAIAAVSVVLAARSSPAKDATASAKTYANRLTPIRDPRPILADHPEFVEPIRETARFASPTLIDDPGADLDVRAWRFSYNARGIVEIPNRLRGDRTAIVVVHPWGIDDGQGWATPEPAGVAFQCTPEKNRIVLDHGRLVIDRFLKAWRGRVAVVAYSLPGKEDPIRRDLYRSVRGAPDPGREAGAQGRLEAALKAFTYQGKALPGEIAVDPETPSLTYFRAFPGLDAGPTYDPKGYWDLPIPVMKTIAVDPRDVVAYDAEGYDVLRDFLKARGVRHVLLAGYNTDMCVCSTTAGYRNLRQDFDVLLVGDATIATFPGNPSPRFATNAAVSFAALDLLITQASWVRAVEPKEADR